MKLIIKSDRNLSYSSFIDLFKNKKILWPVFEGQYGINPEKIDPNEIKRIHETLWGATSEHREILFNNLKSIEDILKKVGNYLEKKYKKSLNVEIWITITPEVRLEDDHIEIGVLPQKSKKELIRNLILRLLKMVGVEEKDLTKEYENTIKELGLKDV